MLASLARLVFQAKTVSMVKREALDLQDRLAHLDFQAQEVRLVSMAVPGLADPKDLMLDFLILYVGF